MASLVNASLPSDDEEDLDYCPSEEDEESKKAKKQPVKRLRGAAAGAQPASDTDPPHVANVSEDEDQVPDERKEAKKAKIDALWSQLSHKAAVPSKPAKVGRASLSKPADRMGKPKGEAWMRELGLSTSKSKQQGGTAAGDKKAVAAAALAAAKNAASSTSAQQYGKVVVTETRRFAGKDITLKKEVAADSKEAQKAAAVASLTPGDGDSAVSTAAQEAEAAAKRKAGLDAVLASLAQPKKVTVLDKSRSDWAGFKGTNDQLEEELETYKKSSSTYLEKKKFLQRAELREYEQERDKRLGSDIRTRGRL